jgi:hypothetical protein
MAQSEPHSLYLICDFPGGKSIEDNEIKLLDDQQLQPSIIPKATSRTPKVLDNILNIEYQH